MRDIIQIEGSGCMIIVLKSLEMCEKIVIGFNNLIKKK